MSRDDSAYCVHGQPKYECKDCIINKLKQDKAALVAALADVDIKLEVVASADYLLVSARRVISAALASVDGETGMTEERRPWQDIEWAELPLSELAKLPLTKRRDYIYGRRIKELETENAELVAALGDCEDALVRLVEANDETRAGSAILHARAAIASVKGEQG